MSYTYLMRFNDSTLFRLSAHGPSVCPHVNHRRTRQWSPAGFRAVYRYCSQNTDCLVLIKDPTSIKLVLRRSRNAQYSIRLFSTVLELANQLVTRGNTCTNTPQVSNKSCHSHRLHGAVFNCVSPTEVSRHSGAL